MKQPNKKRNRARYMNERVNPINPKQDGGMLEEECLNLEFVKDVQTLLQSNYLKGVGAGDFDGSGGHGDGGEGTAELVDLEGGGVLVHVLFALGRRMRRMRIGGVESKALTQYTRAQYQASTRKGNLTSTRLRK